MEAFLNGPLARDFLLVEGIGVALAMVLVVALGLTLPERSRRLLRTPALLLLGHVVTFALALLLPEQTGARRLLGPLALLLLLSSIGRSAVLLMLDVLLGRRLDRPLPRIIRDILQGLVYAGIGIATLHAAGVEPGSLLTTSALLTAVLGLSLQDTLGNVFAGLAIQMQRPFDVGDWIQFDNEPKNIGKVVEINWRATKVLTLDDVEVIVPNGALAKAPIKNFTKPTLASRRSIFFQAPYSAPPAEVHQLVLSALEGAFGVVTDPAPSIVTNNFTDAGVEYWVRFFTDQFHKRDGVDGGVRDRIWYALRRAGLIMPIPNRAVHVHQASPEAAEREREATIAKGSRALRCVDFFRVLSEAELGALAASARIRLFAPGEVIVKKGDETTELYVIDRGEVVVTLGHPGEAGEGREVARLGPGKFFGEMALVTGDKRQATVRAAGPCELVEVSRDAMQEILEKSPDLAERISAVLAERQAALDLHATSVPESKQQAVLERKNELLGKIRKFFEL